MHITAVLALGKLVCWFYEQKETVVASLFVCLFLPFLFLCLLLLLFLGGPVFITEKGPHSFDKHNGNNGYNNIQCVNTGCKIEPNAQTV